VTTPETKEAVKQVVYKIRLLNQWITMYHDLLNKQKLKPRIHEAILCFLSQSPEYSTMLVDLLKLGQHSAVDPRLNQLLMSFTGYNEVDLAFNQLRTRAMTILKKVWHHIITKTPQDVI
jgi:hypothetical protein